MLRPDIVGMRGSMVIRLRPCKTENPPRPPPTIALAPSAAANRGQQQNRAKNAVWTSTPPPPNKTPDFAPPQAVETPPGLHHDGGLPPRTTSISRSQSSAGGCRHLDALQQDNGKNSAKSIMWMSKTPPKTPHFVVPQGDETPAGGIITTAAFHRA